MRKSTSGVNPEQMQAAMAAGPSSPPTPAPAPASTQTPSAQQSNTQVVEKTPAAAIDKVRT